MKTRFLISMLFLSFAVSATYALPKSTRAERIAVIRGNQFFSKGEYSEAIKEYNLALKDNPSSVWALYNSSLAKIQMGSAKRDDENLKKLKDEGIEGLTNISKLAKEYPDLASKASYNLGNNAFRKQDFTAAISLYKEALRANPDNDDARRNLRIAQLKQNKNDKNNKNNKDKNDKNKDKQDKQDKQNQDNKDKQNQDKNKDQQQPQPQDQKIDPQTANQILNAMENKENATRARLLNRGAKKNNVPPSRKNW